MKVLSIFVVPELWQSVCKHPEVLSTVDDSDELSGDQSQSAAVNRRDVRNSGWNGAAPLWLRDTGKSPVVALGTTAHD